MLLNREYHDLSGRTVKIAIIAAFVIIVLSFILDVLLAEGGRVYFFFGAYGMASCFVLVLLARLVGFFVKRREDYYQAKYARRVKIGPQ